MRPERKPDKSDLEEKKGQEGTSEPTDTRPGVGKSLSRGAADVPPPSHTLGPLPESGLPRRYSAYRGKNKNVFTTGPFEQGPQEDHQL